MAKQLSKTAIGSFVISAILLLIVGIVLFGGGKFFKKTLKFAIFFEASVKGLNAGAPVVFRGVQIGSVESVVIRADSRTLDVDIPVVVELEPDRLQLTGELELEKDPFERTKVLIDRGMRARLGMESFVTGQLLVELDFLPDTPVRLTGIDIGHPELPTVPSRLGKLSKTLDKIPVEEIVGKVLATIDHINKLLSAPELMASLRNVEAATANANTLILNTDQLMGDAGQMVGNADRLLVNVNRQVKPLSASLRAGIGDARKLLQDVDSEVKPLSTKAQDALVSAGKALDQVTVTLKTYNSLVSERSELRHDLNTVLNEIAQAARSIRSLTDYLEQHPEALLQGKGSGGRQ